MPEKEYTPDQARVAGYLMERFGLTAGDDPIGTLILSHSGLSKRWETVRYADKYAILKELGEEDSLEYIYPETKPREPGTGKDQVLYMDLSFKPFSLYLDDREDDALAQDSGGCNCDGTGLCLEDPCPHADNYCSDGTDSMTGAPCNACGGFDGGLDNS